MKEKKKIIIGLSGGVDSSVAAKLLKDEGHELIAVFMQNWDDTTGLLDGDCHWEDDWDFAQLVAKQLEIPIHKLDLSKEYRKRIVNYMFEEYEKGRTPNPDVLCNREIKFDAFVDAVKDFNADAVATGHYCGTKFNDQTNEFMLISGIDDNKDQSYFLSQLNQEQLSGSIFPLVDIKKNEVRELAKKFKLPTSNKKDSQGLCFIGKVDLPTFLKQQIIPRPGDVIEEMTTDRASELLFERRARGPVEKRTRKKAVAKKTTKAVKKTAKPAKKKKTGVSTKQPVEASSEV